jgi:hypothetical protein
MSQGLGAAFDRAQRAHDNRIPAEESPMRTCAVCKEEYNSDSQELDSPGKDICDGCIEIANSLRQKQAER